MKLFTTLDFIFHNPVITIKISILTNILRSFKKLSEFVVNLFFISQIIFLSAHSVLLQKNQQTNNIVNLSNRPLPCWSYANNNIKEYKPASDNILRLFLPIVEGKIEALNSNTGKRIWLSDVGGEIIAAPLFLRRFKEKEIVFVVSKTMEHSSDSKSSKFYSTLRALSSDTGITLWQETLPFISKDYLLYGYQNSVVISGRDGNIVSYDTLTGRLIWRIDSVKRFSAEPFVWEDKMIVGEADKLLTVISLDTGKILKRIEIGTSPLYITADNKRIYWGNERGEVFAVNFFNNRTTWKMRNGAAIADIKITNRGLLISSLDNFIYLVSADKGSRIWKRRFAGRIFPTPFIIDDYVLISAVGDSNVSVIDLRNGKKINQISLSVESYLTNSPILAGDILILSTLGSIFSFSFSQGGCLDK